MKKVMINLLKQINYLPYNNSRNLDKSKLCERAKKINFKTIYILKEENNNLKTNVVHCDY